VTRLYLIPSTLPEYTNAAARLEAAGFEVVTAPPEPDTAPEWGAWARYALALLLTADGVVLPRGSGGSRGNGLLCRLAHDLAIPVLTLRGWLTRAGQDAYMARLTGGRP